MNEWQRRWYRRAENAASTAVSHCPAEQTYPFRRTKSTPPTTAPTRHVRPPGFRHYRSVRRRLEQPPAYYWDILFTLRCESVIYVMK